MVAPVTPGLAPQRESGSATQGAAANYFSEQAARQPVHPQAPDPCTPAIAAAHAAIAQHRDATGAMRPGALLPVLHDLQHALGWIPPETAAPLAQAMNLSRAEVHGVVTFYPHFRTSPPARHHIEICRAESCQAMGSDALVEHAQARLGCAMNEQAPDGSVSLAPVYCLGLCAQSPAVMIDSRPYARISANKLDRLLDQLAQEQP